MAFPPDAFVASTRPILISADDCVRLTGELTGQTRTIPEPDRR